MKRQQWNEQLNSERDHSSSVPDPSETEAAVLFTVTIRQGSWGHTDTKHMLPSESHPGAVPTGQQEKSPQHRGTRASGERSAFSNCALSLKKSHKALLTF